MTKEFSSAASNGADYLYNTLFDAMPGNSILLQADASAYTIKAATPGYLSVCGMSKDALIGKGVFDAFPSNPGDPRDTGPRDLRLSLLHVLTHKQPQHLPIQRYDGMNEDGSFSERYWRISNSPVISAEGEVPYIVHTVVEITDQVIADRMAEKIKGMEQAHSLFMQSPVPIQIYKGRNLRLDFVNGATLAVWGKGPDIIGKPLIDALPEIKEQGFVELLLQVMDTGTPFHLYDTPATFIVDGKEVVGYFNSVYQPYYEDDKENAAGVIVFGFDVTDKVLAKRKAEESEERFRVLADEAPVIVFMADPDAVVTYWNKCWLDFTGQSYEQALGRAWNEIVHPDDRVDLLNQYLAATKAEQPYSIQARMKRYDGEYRYILFTGGPRYSPDGVLLGNIGTGIDIHDRINAEQSLQESEQKFRSLVQSAPFPIGVFVGKEMRIELANQSIIDIWGKGNDVLGRLYSELLPELSNLEIFDQLDQVYTTGIAFHAKNQRVELLVAGKLQPFYFNYSFTPLFDAGGKVYGVMNTAADVTDLNLAKQRVEQSERNFRSLVLKAPVGICIVAGEDAVVEEVNEAFLELIGRPRTAFEGHPYWAVLDEAASFYAPILKEVFESGIAYHGREHEVMLVRNGREEVVYINFVYEPIKEADGNINKVMILSLDQTQQVMARKKIEESEEKYRSLFETMDQGFCIIEMIFDDENKAVDYRFVEINPIFEEQTGLKDAAGKTIRELLPDHEAQWFDHYGKVALTGEAVRFVERSEPIGRWFEVYAFQIGNRDSRKVAVLFTDITERRKTEEAVKQSEQNLRNIILQAPVAMCILIGPDHIVDIANEAMIGIWGKPAEEVMHKPLFEGLPDARQQGLEQLLENVYRTGERFVANERPVELLRNGKLDVVYQNFVYEPYRNAQAEILGVLAISVDVTEQVLARQKIEEVVVLRTKELGEAYNALKRNNDELIRSNNNLEEFAYAASHDLKEPIRKVRTFSDRLKNNLRDRLKEEDLHYFQRMEKATERMQNLIDDLLEYSHVSTPNNFTEKIDLAKKVQQVLEDLELEVVEKNAKILVSHLPVVKGHRRQLQQLFQNLITNALKFTRPGIPPEIRISSSIVKGEEATAFIVPDQFKNELYHLIEIADNGIGFEQEYAEKIFKMFQRLHGKAEYAGTGIGLAIVRKVVENHKGFIRADSTPGEGATFKVLLPVD